MRALKFLVVVMGLLLVAGTAALVVAVMSRANHRPAASAALAAAGMARVDLPPGAHIVSTELSADRVLVRVALADGGDELLLFDTRTGARVGIIDLHPTVPAAAPR